MLLIVVSIRKIYSVVLQSTDPPDIILYGNMGAQIKYFVTWLEIWFDKLLIVISVQSER